MMNNDQVTAALTDSSWIWSGQFSQTSPEDLDPALYQWHHILSLNDNILWQIPMHEV